MDHIALHNIDLSQLYCGLFPVNYIFIVNTLIIIKAH